MNEELISIIVPVYNVEPYLDRCVESIVRQSYIRIEILLMDDASTDASGVLCDNWAQKDMRIKVFHLLHGGLSVARNKGLEVMTGQYVMFVDSDDYVTADFVANAYENMKRYEADAVIFDFVNFYETKPTETPERGKNVGLVDINRIRHMMYSKRSDVVYLAWNKLYRRELFEGLTYPQGRIYEDNAIAHKWLEKCKTIVYDENQYYFRQMRDDSIMGKSKKQFQRKHLVILYGQRERCELYKDLPDKKLVFHVFAEYLHTLIQCYYNTHYVLKDKDICRNLFEEFSERYKEAKRYVKFDIKKRIGYFAFRCMPKFVIGVMHIRKNKE